jgi:hypothetical protein
MMDQSAAGDGHDLPPPAGRHVVPGAGYAARMFAFYSNRLGCFGSLLVSAVLTALLILVLTVLF